MTKNYLRLAAIALISTCLLSSCASMFTKTSYPVAINSTPSEADVKITNKKGKIVYEGKTPATVKLKSSNGFFSGAEYNVEISMEGFSGQNTTISSGIEGWYFANILLGGIIGMLIVDPATGAMWKLEEEAINLKLQPKSNAENTLQIIDIKDIPEDKKDQLVRVN